MENILDDGRNIPEGDDSFDEEKSLFHHEYSCIRGKRSREERRENASETMKNSSRRLPSIIYSKLFDGWMDVYKHRFEQPTIGQRFEKENEKKARFRRIWFDEEVASREWNLKRKSQLEKSR